MEQSDVPNAGISQKHRELYEQNDRKDLYFSYDPKH